MLETYSTNITVADNTAIPFNNVNISKGCTAILAGPATVQLNKCGVYMISCDASLAPTAAGEIGIQLSKNGILQPQAQSVSTGTADSYDALSFTTLVQVAENNTCSCCTSPTTIQVINSIESDYAIASITVTKIC